jgi:hypothetical protein
MFGGALVGALLVQHLQTTGAYFFREVPLEPVTA